MSLIFAIQLTVVGHYAPRRLGNLIRH